MQDSQEEMRDHVLSLLQASRELSPANDEALADAFVRQLTRRARDQRIGAPPGPARYISASALAILVAIPVVMVIQAYSEYDGYLPRLDAGALPLLYWIALAAALLILAASFVSERTGWQLRLTATRKPSRQ